MTLEVLKLYHLTLDCHNVFFNEGVNAIDGSVGGGGNKRKGEKKLDQKTNLHKKTTKITNGYEEQNLCHYSFSFNLLANVTIFEIHPLPSFTPYPLSMNLLEWLIGVGDYL